MYTNLIDKMNSIVINTSAFNPTYYHTHDRTLDDNSTYTVAAYRSTVQRLKSEYGLVSSEYYRYEEVQKITWE